jgi:hypothetical protein
MRILSIEQRPFHEIHYLSSGPQGRVRDCTLPFLRASVDRLPEGVSAFVAASDLQGRERGARNRLLGELVAEELFVLQELDVIPQVSGVLLAGDLYDYPDCRKLGGTGDVTCVWNAFAERFHDVVGVLGNHDLVDDAGLPGNAAALDGTSTRRFGFDIAGVSGIIGGSGKNQRRSADQFLTLLKRVLRDSTDILLLHQGPDHPATDRIGAPEIRQVLESRGSCTVVFGHCFWPSPWAQIGANQVVNVDSRLILFAEADAAAVPFSGATG